MAVRVRKNAHSLATWDPIFEWYARGVRQMQTRPITDPTSWRYQAAIHDYVVGGDPNAQPGETLPSAAERARFWGQCQHFCWFFLPWHRMYLFHFERIVAAAVEELGGPAGWALPYWNYSAKQPDARRIPAAFREARLPDGSENPLLVLDRDFANDGSPIGSTADVEICTALRKTRFASQSLGGDPGFGGGRSGFNHRSAPGMVPGELERVPHGSVHSEVGGFMGLFNTAGLDPLFWLHHANIDRLWEVWRRRAPANRDPADALWQTGVKFAFHDAAGNIVQHTSSQFVTTSAAPLEFEYDDVSDPCAAIESAAPEDEAVDERKPELVGATAAPIALTGQPVVAQFSISPPSGPASELEAAGVAPEIYLNVENITGSGRPVSHSVYLNVPAGEQAEQHPELFAGVLPMFGVSESTRSDAAHAGSGLQYTLEVSEVVQTLQSRHDWDPNNIRITFVPRRAGGLESTAAESAIQVGRVSLYIA